MSHGPTKRVQRLVADGSVPADLLRAADREADLLAHPYIGVEHVELARLAGSGRLPEREALRRELTPGVPSKWWRPRSRHSVLSRRGRARTREAQRRAQRSSGVADDDGT